MAISLGGHCVIVVLLAERLHIYRCHLERLNHPLLDGIDRRRLFAQQMGEVALLPATVRSVDCAILTNTQKQRVDHDLRRNEDSGMLTLPKTWIIRKQKLLTSYSDSTMCATKKANTAMKMHGIT